MKKILELRGLLLLLVLASAMYVQQNLTVLTWVALGLLCLYCLFKWRQAVSLVFIWLTIEGFLRKWTGNSILVFFFKDIMLVMIYLSFLNERISQRKRIIFSNPINLPLVCLAVLSIIQLFNPEIGSLLVGLVGLRTLFFYVFLFYIAYSLFDSKKEVLQFCLLLLVVAIPICLYAVRQHFKGPSYYASLGESFIPWVVGIQTEVGGVFKPDSTFSFISVFSGYLLFITLLCISMLNVKEKPLFRGIVWLSFICILGGLIISAQRSCWTLLVLTFPLLAVLERKMGFFLKSTLAFIIIFFILILLNPTIKEEFFQRTINMFMNPTTTYGERADTILSWHLPIMRTYLFFGSGIGMGALGRRYVEDQNVEMTGMEFQYGKMCYELSILGLLIFAWLLVRLLRVSWGIHRKIEDRDLKWLSSGIFMYQCAILLNGTVTNILDQPIQAILFWFFSGVLLKIPLLTIEQSQIQESQ